jgi:hypothetical protein
MAVSLSKPRAPMNGAAGIELFIGDEYDGRSYLWCRRCRADLGTVSGSYTLGDLAAHAREATAAHACAPASPQA